MVLEDNLGDLYRHRLMAGEMGAEFLGSAQLHTAHLPLVLFTLFLSDCITLIPGLVYLFSLWLGSMII